PKARPLMSLNQAIHKQSQRDYAESSDDSDAHGRDDVEEEAGAEADVLFDKRRYTSKGLEVEQRLTQDELDMASDTD
ncbi:hypothetical protein KIPB_000054, partial [Kipferlia bialata]